MYRSNEHFFTPPFDEENEKNKPFSDIKKHLRPAQAAAGRRILIYCSEESTFLLGGEAAPGHQERLALVTK